jgi:hypothetical protein
VNQEKPTAVASVGREGIVEADLKDRLIEFARSASIEITLHEKETPSSLAVHQQ